MTGPRRHLLVVTEGGYGKRVPVADISVHKRGGQGVRVSSEPVAEALLVGERDTLVIATARGKIVRLAACDVPIRRRRQSYGSPGVPIVRLEDGDRVTAVAIDQTPP
jgi:DNA gyrase subunit A